MWFYMTNINEEDGHWLVLKKSYLITFITTITDTENI